MRSCPLRKIGSVQCAREAAPYTAVKFMPTGGISAKNLKGYLECDKIICCCGSWIVKGDLIRNGEFDKMIRSGS